MGKLHCAQLSAQLQSEHEKKHGNQNQGIFFCGAEGLVTKQKKRKEESLLSPISLLKAAEYDTELQQD